MVQLFEDKKLWVDIGYKVISGSIEDNQETVLARTPESSPEFLAKHSPIDDLLIFKDFDSIKEEADWIAGEIIKNIREDELRYDDIIIIHPNPMTTRNYMSLIRTKLMQNNIESHIAGYHTSPDEFFQKDSITISQIYRAKGNEAAMVYFVNADYCYDGYNLASKRNILFTGITRSKAWVRVSVVLKNMSKLIDEFEKVKKHNFELNFIYPDERQRKKLRIIHRDRTKTEQEAIRKTENSLKDTIKQLEEGKIKKEDLPKELINDILEILGHEH